MPFIIKYRIGAQVASYPPVPHKSTADWIRDMVIAHEGRQPEDVWVEEVEPPKQATGCTCPACGQDMACTDLFRGPICWNAKCSRYGQWC